MLLLSRNVDEKVIMTVIGEHGKEIRIVVQLIKIKSGKQVSLGFTAPEEVIIVREEIE